MEEEGIAETFLDDTSIADVASELPLSLSLPLSLLPPFLSPPSLSLSHPLPPHPLRTRNLSERTPWHSQ